MSSQDINYAITFAANQEGIHDPVEIQKLIDKYHNDEEQVGNFHVLGHFQINMPEGIQYADEMLTYIQNNIEMIQHVIQGNLNPNFANDVKKTLTNDALNKLAKIPYDKLLKKDDNCAICLDKFEDIENKLFLQLPCEHEFHAECIEPHFKSCDYRCPICRKECGEYKCDV